MAGPMRVFNTLGRVLTELEPAPPARLGMYVCGPTVQSEPHLGHGRSAVAFDTIRRYLRWRGYDVTYVRNVTDIEDKIIAAAQERGMSVPELAEEMSARFAETFAALAVEAPDVEPRATEHIPEIIELIARLIDRGLAYPSGGDVYFSVRGFEGYGKLSGRRPDELLSGARVEVSDAKQDPLDFALWKAAKPGEPWWHSPWGRGRPGWHIECSAMAMKYLGETIDIHGGGNDLIFPHHENEIAQSEGATGKPFAQYWLHNGMVNLAGEKMSKSTGVLVDLAEAIRRFGGMAVRLLYLRAHYRSPLEFREELVADAASAVERLDRFRRRFPPPDAAADPEALERFRRVMDDDFGTPEAVGLLFDLVREANRMADEGQDPAGIVAAFYEIAGVLGLVFASTGLDDLADPLASLAAEFGVEVDGDPVACLESLLARRRRAREERDWPLADAIRDRLDALGIVVEDSADGTRWHRR